MSDATDSPRIDAGRDREAGPPAIIRTGVAIGVMVAVAWLFTRWHGDGHLFDRVTWSTTVYALYRTFKIEAAAAEREIEFETCSDDGRTREAK